MMYFIIKVIVRFKSQLEKFRLRFAKYCPPQDSPKSGMAKEEVIKEIAKVPFWFHCIELGWGIVTPGHQGDFKHPTGSKNLLDNLHLPENLKGKSVLDIGAWDGFFSFQAEKRGAGRILAIDNFYRGDDLESTESQGFEVAKKILDSKVEFKKASVYDLDPVTFGTFDIVLFLGVLYHLKHPILALEKIYSCTKEMIILDTHYDPYYLKNSAPLAKFYQGTEINNDMTTWWGFNESGLLAALSATGFKNAKVIYRYADRIVVKAFV